MARETTPAPPTPHNETLKNKCIEGFDFYWDEKKGFVCDICESVKPVPSKLFLFHSHQAGKMTQVEAANSNPNEAFVKAFQETQEWNASFNWPEPRTFVYKEVDGIKIEADVYAREPTADDHAAAGSPIMVFIHGGGWMGGTRTDFSRPTFHEFITRGFVIVSIDYRLLPEVDFLTGQLQDIASAEGWIREKFQADLKEAGSRVKVDTDRIVVSGASAGAHLASLVVCIRLLGHGKRKIKPQLTELFSHPAQNLEKDASINPAGRWPDQPL